MRVLFVVAVPSVLEQMGVMLLSACCKQDNHETALCILKTQNLCRKVDEFQPDVVAYSAMGLGIEEIKRADRQLLAHLEKADRTVFRIMGGPHPTFQFSVLDEMKLDAICVGDGDKALPGVLKCLATGDPIEDVPNIAVTSAGPKNLERLSGAELDALPFADRAFFYKEVPYVGYTGLRSFFASRGCPYNCSYCYNDVYNRMFRGHGKIVRRRSVENLLSEIEYVRRQFPPLRYVRFFDDTFAHTADDWLREFAEEYPKRIGLPFYCLMRCNTFTEETAALLAKAGCYCVTMGIDAASEEIRNGILDRNLSNEELERAFALAHKYKMRTYGNTMLGIVGGSLEEDFRSLDYTRKLGLTVPTFTVFSPLGGTKIAKIAADEGLLDGGQGITRLAHQSPLNCFTPKEKEIQLRMCYLGTLYCTVPDFFVPVVRAFIRHRLMPRWMTRHLGFTFEVASVGLRIFPHSLPRSPVTLARLAFTGIVNFL